LHLFIHKVLHQLHIEGLHLASLTTENARIARNPDTSKRSVSNYMAILHHGREAIPIILPGKVAIPTTRARPQTNLSKHQISMVLWVRTTLVVQVKLVWHYKFLTLLVVLHG
jgi:hypothetical protein